MRRTTIGVTAIAAGAAWLIWEALRLTWDGASGSDCASGPEYAGDAVFAIAGALTGLTLLLFAGQLAGLTRTLALLGAASAAVWGVANGVEHCAFEPLFLLYAAGGLAFVVSTAALGVSILVTGALGRWPGVLLVAAAIAPMMLSFERSGAALGGAMWIVFGLTLLLNRQALGAPATPAKHTGATT